MKTYNTTKAASAQKKYCADHGYICFAPASGRCPRCGHNIYEPLECGEKYVTGFDISTASSQIITGCPHCHTTFCD